MICLFLALAASGCGSGIVDPAEFDAVTAPAKTFPVSQFGAKGDGLADDAPAIQRALAAAAVLGGQVLFGCGEFRLASVAGQAPAGRSLLYLKGASGVQIAGQGRCSHLFTSIPQATVLELEDSTAVAVSSLRITALNAAYIEKYGMGGGSAVRFSGVARGSISHVEVDGAAAGALYLTKGTSQSSIANNFVHDTYGAGIWEDDCGAASSTSCAPSTPPANNVYAANTLVDTSRAMLAAITVDDGGASAQAVVKANAVSWTHPPLPSNPKVHCIQIGNAADVSVLDNTCSGTPWDAIAITTANGQRTQRIAIQGNILSQTGSPSVGGSGIVVYNDPAGAGISNIAISSNNIANAADDGIRLYSGSGPGGVTDSQLLSNTIRMVDQRAPGTRFGIDVEFSARVAVQGNTIAGDGRCIAAGVNINASPATAPTPAANPVSNILGPPLVID